ncbi:hypothetical protein REPUB_Repub10bG0134300 [Reevesia pubescens]
MSISSNGQSEHTANNGFSSYTNNPSSGRNQNLHPNARPSLGVAQAFGYMNHMYPNSMSYGHYGNTIEVVLVLDLMAIMPARNDYGAFSEAKEKPDGCPVFLLFSVNTSGQFVGLAEMVDQVDFHKTVEYWQYDKWTGCFPVKWHIVNDVPNTSMRHITLENNENKPVTNSRDTHEVNFEKGIQILKIFKGHSKNAAIAKETLEKYVVVALIGEPVVASTAEVVKANGDVKAIEENGSVAATEDSPMKSACVASAC